MFSVMTFCQMYESKTNDKLQNSKPLNKNYTAIEKQRNGLNNCLPVTCNPCNHVTAMNNITQKNNKPKKTLGLIMTGNPAIVINSTAESFLNRQIKTRPQSTSPLNNESPPIASSILPPAMLPNIFVQPLINKWKPNALKIEKFQNPTLLYTSSEGSTCSDPIHSDYASFYIENENRYSLYNNTLHLLANDVDYQKEVVLGKRIGFYRIGKELGSGNFSKVKLGVHVLTKENVAIKIMERSKMDKKAQKLLIREIDNMELMHHPNIIRLFECVETLSKVYLIMEYAGGGELFTYVYQNGRLTEDVTRPIFAQLISAVTHLHTKGIIHRDIKAENVIFAYPGWVKLADFGFSCKYEANKLLKTLCGSPPYAAPELFQDKNYNGFKVDIWALGVLLYFMLVGNTPFSGETMQDLKRNILDRNYKIPEYVSTFAQNLITRMLQTDILKRPSILELQRTYWLKNNKFPESYLQLSLNPDEKKLESNEVERRVWEILKKFGINESMIREATGKGSRNPIIGTYRIVLYQCQAKNMDEERMRINNHLVLLTERNQYLSIKAAQQTRACVIL